MRAVACALVAAVAAARLGAPPRRRLEASLDMAKLSEDAAVGALGSHVLFKLDGDDALVKRGDAAAVTAKVVGALGCDGEATRVFRHAGKHEAAHAAFGLDLWYEVACEADGLDAGAFTEDLPTEDLPAEDLPTECETLDKAACKSKENKKRCKYSASKDTCEDKATGGDAGESTTKCKQLDEAACKSKVNKKRCKWKNKCKDKKAKSSGGGSCKVNKSEDSCKSDALGCKWKKNKCKDSKKKAKQKKEAKTRRLAAPEVKAIKAMADSQNVYDALRRFLDSDAHDGVVIIEPELDYATSFTPDDPGFNTQSHYDAVNLRDAWDLTTGNPNVVVQVLDTGIELDHPDLQLNIWTNPGEICGNGVDDDFNGYVDDCAFPRLDLFSPRSSAPRLALAATGRPDEPHRPPRERALRQTRSSAAPLAKPGDPAHRAAAQATATTTPTTRART
jgi:hypothetical protein